MYTKLIVERILHNFTVNSTDCYYTSTKSNRVFSNRTTKSFVYYMEKARKHLGIKNSISAHSGRNSVVERMLIAGVSSDNICIAFNWARGSEMLYRYRNRLIETSIMGAQHILCDYDNKEIEMAETSTFSF